MSERDDSTSGDLQWPAADRASVVPEWAAPGSNPEQASAASRRAPSPPPALADAPAPSGPPAPLAAPPTGAPASAVPAYAPGATPTFRSWQPGIIALRPLTFGDFLAVPFKAMRYNRAVVLGGPLLFVLISLVLTVSAFWVAFNDPQLGLSAANPPLSGINPETAILLGAAIVAALLADVLSSAIVAPGVARAVMGERISVATAWAQMKPRMGHLLLLYVFTGLALLFMFAVSMVPMLMSAQADAPTGFAIGVILLLFVTLPGALAVTVLAGMARPIVVLEKRGAVSALGRVRALIPGRFWWSMLIIFVAGILIYIASIALQYAGSFLALLATLFAPENPVVFAVAFFGVYGAAIVVSSVLQYSYLGSIFSLLYIDVRMRREGFDMDLAQAAEARGRA